jgi:CBS domain-containing protein/osmotically-inducible protein OsmY
MTCKDIMTPNPSCCLPGDSATIAAQIMRRNDIGPVLVVSDRHDNRLVGIVTDRDLALKIIADGRDPHTTRVDEVMTLNPVCCREEDDTAKAAQLMAQNQVRRIPIVDEGNRLRGILAQADLARNVDEEDVGRTVEKISEPYPTYGKGTHGYGEAIRSAAPGQLAISTLCMGIGAGLMYLLDPLRGSTRRSALQKRTTGLYNSSGEALGSKSRHIKNRAAGIVASAKSLMNTSEDVTDEKLVSRIRSRIGRYVSHARAVQVTANEGNVILSGPILADEVPELLDCVNAIPGVKSVESRLEVHETAGSHPSLQGGRDVHNYERTKAGWSPATRLIAGLAGGGLLLYGLRARSGKAAGVNYREMAGMGRRTETPGY